MTENSLDQAAGKTLEIELGGKVYKVSAFTIGDFVALRDRMRTKRIEAFKIGADVLDAQERLRGLMELAQRPISQEDAEAELETTDGMLFMLWRMLRRGDKELTFEAVQDLLDIAAMQQLMAIVGGLTGEIENPPEGEETP